MDVVVMLVVSLLVCASPAPAVAATFDPTYAFTVNNATIGYVEIDHLLVLASSEKYILPDLWSMYERTETVNAVEFYYVMLKRNVFETFAWCGSRPGDVCTPQRFVNCPEKFSF